MNLSGRFRWRSGHRVAAPLHRRGGDPNREFFVATTFRRSLPTKKPPRRSLPSTPPTYTRTARPPRPPESPSITGLASHAAALRHRHTRTLPHPPPLPSPLHPRLLHLTLPWLRPRWLRPSRRVHPRRRRPPPVPPARGGVGGGRGRRGGRRRQRPGWQLAPPRGVPFPSFLTSPPRLRPRRRRRPPAPRGGRPAHHRLRVGAARPGRGVGSGRPGGGRRGTSTRR
jgi:hypothetical protein